MGHMTQITQLQMPVGVLGVRYEGWHGDGVAGGSLRP